MKSYKVKMNILRELVENNQQYPPTENLWKQILGIILNEEKNNNLTNYHMKMLQEQDFYKPSLPEPTVVRLYHHGVFYYLDSRGNLYLGDDGNPLVGNLVGKIEEREGFIKVFIKNKELLEIPSNNLNQLEMYNRTYYQDDQKKIYCGLHPQLRYAHMMGVLNNENKIDLL